MTDAEMIRCLQRWRTDADLSGLVEHAKQLGEIEARMAELTALAGPVWEDLEAKWEAAWRDTIAPAIDQVVNAEIERAVVRAADILRGQ